VTLDRNVRQWSLNTKQAVKHSLEIQVATSKNILTCRCLHGHNINAHLEFCVWPSAGLLALVAELINEIRIRDHRVCGLCPSSGIQTDYKARRFGNWTCFLL
jgi:hypothetical protein